MTDRIQEELSEHDGKEDFLFFVPFDLQERHSLKRNVCKAHQLPFPIVVCANAPEGNAMQRKSVSTLLAQRSPKCGKEEALQSRITIDNLSVISG
ncbi:hypothetical protein CDAR_238731 [Caerostris darwini]|uniref:Uncharacterized protein n=1 Tax=Caerostris darwini TaxID=1538125 RepID=A0AAV4PVG4_9ARAC|nr:hypothetical protein CDAR_238731 [Caerostris darwini]